MIKEQAETQVKEAELQVTSAKEIEVGEPLGFGAFGQGFKWQNKIDSNFLSKIKSENSDIRRLALKSEELEVSLDDLFDAISINKSIISIIIWIIDVPDSQISKLAKNNTIQSLSFPVTYIGDEGAEALSKINSLKKLSVFHGNLITDKSGIALANSNISEITLVGGLLTDQSAIAFAKNKTIRKLIIPGNRITDIGAIELAKSMNIRDLSLADNFISEKGYEAFLENYRLFYLTTCLNSTLNKKLDERMADNRRIPYRDNFVRNMIILAREWKKENSLLSNLPLEIILHCISFIDFSALGKTTKQGISFTEFIFNNIDKINNLLSRKDGLKIIEKRQGDTSKFRFFEKTRPATSLYPKAKRLKAAENLLYSKPITTELGIEKFTYIQEEINMDHSLFLSKKEQASKIQNDEEEGKANEDDENNVGIGIEAEKKFNSFNSGKK